MHTLASDDVLTPNETLYKAHQIQYCVPYTGMWQPRENRLT